MREALQQYVDEILCSIPLTNEQTQFILLILRKFPETGIEEYDQIVAEDYKRAIRAVVNTSFPLS